jgi:hypothetical protein
MPAAPVAVLETASDRLVAPTARVPRSVHAAGSAAPVVTVVVVTTGSSTTRTLVQVATFSAGVGPA